MPKKKSYCHDCNREFANQAALAQHLSSSIHAIARFRCPECSRDFASKSALAQHRSSSIHRPTYSCDYCSRVFSDQTALNQHVNSPAHAPTYSCYDCDRDFVSQQALDQHCTYSPAHQIRFHCRDCDRDFVNQAALDQHLNSSIHATQFHCCECDRDFGSETALEQHLRDKFHRPQKSARARFYCQKCDREFGGDEALRKHLASVVHHPLIQDVKCISGGSCDKRFSSPSTMLHHLESGACSSGISKRRIDQVILERDTENIITSQNSGVRIQESLPMGASNRNPFISSSSDDIVRYNPTSSTHGGFSPTSSGTLAPTYSVDDGILCRMAGKCSCPICGRKFSNPGSLRTHIYSAVHSPKIYHCPLPLVPSHLRGNGKLQNFSTLSGLTQHLESGACKGGKNTFRKAMGLVNGKLRELGFADMRLIH